MKRLRTVLALALLVTAFQMTATIRSAAACAGLGTRVHSFHVDAEWARKTYRRGDRALVTITVTRPAHEDPLGLGVPIDPLVSVPEPGVTVATSLQTGYYPYPYGAGITDENGQVKLKIPLKDVPKKGPLDASTLVWKMTNQGGAACTEIEEWGYLYQPAAIVIV